VKEAANFLAKRERPLMKGKSPTPLPGTSRTERPRFVPIIAVIGTCEPEDLLNVRRGISAVDIAGVPKIISMLAVIRVTAPAPEVSPLAIAKRFD
jgi:hypothetical protein